MGCVMKFEHTKFEFDNQSVDDLPINKIDDTVYVEIFMGVLFSWLHSTMKIKLTKIKAPRKIRSTKITPLYRNSTLMLP